MTISSKDRRKSFSIEDIDSGNRPTMTPTGWKHVVRRSDRGLSVDGTRLSLYLIMDHVKAGWPRDEIQDVFNLSDEQIDDVLDYILVNREEFETEYNEVVQAAEERERYWRARNAEHLKRVAQLPPPPGKERIWEKLQARKRELDMK